MHTTSKTRITVSEWVDS